MSKLKAEIPNRFDFQAAAKRIYQLWEKSGHFHSEPDPARQPFTVVIPPPNVTGALHLGHALNNTLQDILVRTRRMQGRNTLWMPGTDHAGIATQAVVEKRIMQEENKSRHDLGREELVRRIWLWKDQYEARIIEQLKQMGCSCDWQRLRFTFDPVCARAVRRTFFDLFQQGLIFRGKRLVNWDTHLQTAVSDDEVFHETVNGHFWRLKYPIVDPRAGEPQFVEIATTRPETMLGDTAVAVHPDPEDALNKAEQALREKLAAAPAREKPAIELQLESVIARQQTGLGLLVQLRDMALDKRNIRLPLMEREIPLIVDIWARPELGSGCVKITPAHDANDYQVWQRHPEIGAVNILNPDGTLNANAGTYQNLTIVQARRCVVADMQQRELVVDVEDREIELAHSDRSQTPIEPLLADQWFLRMGDPKPGETPSRPGLAQTAIDAVTEGRVRFFPARYSKAYLDWLAEKRDWCISRNLWWGHQIPVWSKSCQNQSDEQDLIERLKSAGQIRAGHTAITVEPNVDHQQGEPTSAWSTVHVCVNDSLDDCQEKLEKLGFVRSEHVLDTWFSSALWTHSTLGWPERTGELKYYYPTSVLVTGRDIITLWVARMVLMGLNNVGDVPFREVYVHPKILDGYGETMSKSKGNGVDPLDIVDKFGPDGLRFGLAQLTTETQDVRMPVQYECPGCETLIPQTKKNRELPTIDCTHCKTSFATQWANTPEQRALPRGLVVSERFEQARNFANKLWNAARFVLMNLVDYQAAEVDADDLRLEDRWMLSRLATVTTNVSEALDGYHFADASRELYNFAWDEFCSFYVEMLKDRLNDPQQRALAQRLMAHALDVLLRLLHPFLPFITEEIWQLLADVAQPRGIKDPAVPEECLISARWPQADTQWIDREMEEQFGQFQAVLGALREIRSRQNIAPKKQLRFAARCSEQMTDRLSRMNPYFSSMANARCLGLGPSAVPPPINATIALAEAEIFVDLAGMIDVQAESSRLEKERGRLIGTVEGKQRKLTNQDFLQRAPADVVERERDSLRQAKEQLAAVEQALQALGRNK